MDDVSEITVQVVYALDSQQEIMSVQIPTDSTVKQAIERSGILYKYKQIDLSKNAVGVYGKVVALEHELKEQDRIEIYRPLTIDPMQARRARAALQS